MVALGLLVLALMTVPLLYREPPPPARVEQAVHRHGTQALEEVLSKLREPAWLVTLAFIGTVKIGEAMVGAVIKPYLVREANFTDARAAFAVGLVGGTLSLAGSALGGWASSYGRLRMLAAFGIAQAVTVFALGVAVMVRAPEPVLVAAIGIEHLGVGLLTPVLFAYMMDVTDPDVGATHYTLLATVELVAKSAGSILSGPLSDLVGAAPLMMLAGTAGALPLLLLPWIRRPAADVTLATA
jgi:predicted MFS family arabinose efflux permease